MDSEQRARAQALIEAEAWDDAAAFLDGIAGGDEDVAWLALRADVDAGSGDLDAAAGRYEQLLSIQPDNAAALYNASLVLSDLGRHDDAMTALEALIEAEGESPSVLNDLSYEYLEAEHYVPALLAAERAEALADDEEQRCLARLNGATALANMGRRAQARERVGAMLAACTGACGERDTALELQRDLEARLGRQSAAR